MNQLRNINGRKIFRSIFRNKLHSLINIIGFAVGIAVFILIVKYVNHQFSFDSFHKQSHNIYKIHLGDNKSLPPATAQFLKDNIAAIEDVVRIDEWYGGGNEGFLESDNKMFKTSDLIFADNSFFDFFDFELLYGDFKNALEAPNSIILSQSLSQKIFGNENPTGKCIEYISNYPSAKYSFTVQGVIEDVPTNSSLMYNGIISMSTIPFHHIRNGNISEDWRNWGFGTYVKITKPEIVQQLNAETPDFWTNRVSERWHASKDYQLNFVPLKEVHFQSGTKRSSVYLIFLIGLVILVIAIINYINLSLAISTTRVKEIGIRKVIGSDKKTLFQQFLAESILVTSISATVAVFMVFLIHPYLYKFTGFKAIIEPGEIFSIMLFLILGVISIGIISGIYPALFLTNLAPIRSLKNEYNKGGKGKIIKRVLITTQFVISIILLVSVLTFSKQANYIKDKDLGFEKDQIIYLSGSSSIDSKYQAFRESLLKNPNIQNVARSNGTFAGHLNISSKHKVNGEFRNYKATTVDPDFVETFGIEIIEGRNFSWENKNDLNNTALVNECFVKTMELNRPVGSKVNYLGDDITIIGVIKDFNVQSLHHEIEPSMLSYKPWNVCINIKVSGFDMENTIASIENTWNDFTSDVPFDYKFLDENFKELYQSETEFNSLIKVFTILAVFIACLGLFGLISFSALQSRKEIGIRKVNGAKISEILALLSKDLVIWVVLAFFIASPIAYFTMNKWLENFAYKTDLSWWVFALAGLLTLGIALLTVSWQSFKAARRNPIEALRYE
jgi:putative ABC transport system permease protein